MVKYVLIVFIILLPFLSSAQVTSDPKEAFESAAASGRPVLLVFEGSDWCIPCIKLDKRVLSTDSFIHFANENLIVLKADFPQKKKIQPLLAQQYEKLAGEFNKEGIFPKMILLNAAQKEIGNISTGYKEPEALIQKLQEELKRYHEDM